MKQSGLVLLVLVPAAILAQEQPIVRIDVEPANVTVGEAIQLQVTVLVPTFFPKPPSFPEFELANAITRLPPDSSFPTSERIGGATWAGIVRNYQLYPLTGANFRINGESIGVTYANPGSDPISMDVAVPDIDFAGIVPAGAKSLDPYLAGSQLQLSLDVGGNGRALEIGDAIVLNYTASLEGLPAIFLPPIAPALEYAGASVYADRPVVTDGPPATRAEKITIVFEAGGTFDVPPVALDYWNTESGRVETARADAASFEVTGLPPSETVHSEELGGGLIWQRVALIALVLALTIGAIRLLAPRVIARAETRAAQRRDSERYAYGKLDEALSRGRPKDAYVALISWTSRLEPRTDSRSFAARYGDEGLQASLDSLIRSRFGAGDDVDLRLMRSQLARARSRYKSSGTASEIRALPPLNPGTARP